MNLAEKYDIPLFGRTLKEVASDIVSHCPDPKQLDTKMLTLSIEEEASLDQLYGMFWPHHLYLSLTRQYGEAGDGTKISGSIQFENQTCIHVFKVWF